MAQCERQNIQKALREPCVQLVKENKANYISYHYKNFNDSVPRMHSVSKDGKHYIPQHTMKNYRYKN